MQTLKKNPEVDSVMLRGLGEFLGEQETNHHMAEFVGFNLEDSDTDCAFTPEGDLPEHVRFISELEFVERFVLDLE